MAFAGVTCGCLAAGDRFFLSARGTKIANKTAGKPPRRALGRSNWPLSSPCRNAATAPRPRAGMQPQQDAVVAVKDGDAFGRAPTILVV